MGRKIESPTRSKAEAKLSPDLWLALASKAKQQNTTHSVVIRKALEAYLNNAA